MWLTFSLHCLCSSSSNLFTSRLRLVYLTLKIPNDLPIFASYYALVIVSLTWLAYILSHDYLSYINSLGLLFIFCFSLTEGQRSKRWTLLSVSAVRQPFCFDLNLMFLTERQKVICLCNRLPTAKTCHGPNIFQHISIILFVCLRINEFNWQTFPRHSYPRHLGSSLGLVLRLSLIYLQCNNLSLIMHLQCQ